MIWLGICARLIEKFCWVLIRTTQHEMLKSSVSLFGLQVRRGFYRLLPRTASYRSSICSASPPRRANLCERSFSRLLSPKSESSSPVWTTLRPSSPCGYFLLRCLAQRSSAKNTQCSISFCVCLSFEPFVLGGFCSFLFLAEFLTIVTDTLLQLYLLVQ